MAWRGATDVAAACWFPQLVVCGARMLRRLQVAWMHVPASLVLGCSFWRRSVSCNATWVLDTGYSATVRWRVGKWTAELANGLLLVHLFQGDGCGRCTTLPGKPGGQRRTLCRACRVQSTALSIGRKGHIVYAWNVGGVWRSLRHRQRLAGIVVSAGRGLTD